jgi:hypothetical protein
MAGSVRHLLAIRTIFAGLCLAGCTQAPLGPTVQASPGPGKTFDAFQADLGACKQFAAAQVTGQAQAVNQAASAAYFGTALAGGTAEDAQQAVASTTYGQQQAIQQEYDNSYAQCMYGHGETVAGYAPPTTGVAYAAHEPDPMVRSVQRELIRLNYMHGAADGLSGPKTSAAIRSFERADGMPVDSAPSRRLLAQLQATPSSAGAGTAPVAANAPASSPASSWVAPVSTGSNAGGAPATQAGPTGSTGWVAPVK